MYRRTAPLVSPLVTTLIATLVAVCVVILPAPRAYAADGSLLTPASSWSSYTNVAYTSANRQSQKLDLYVPKNGQSRVPLVIWVHGGAWISGSKDKSCVPYVSQFMKLGWAVACINYRLSNEARWPAQIIDVKSAIRMLRAKASTYRLYADKFAVWGASAGGHLALMAALPQKPEWDQGSYTSTSSAVHAVMDDYGPTDLYGWSKDPNWTFYANQLLGVDVSKNKAVADAASPITYVRGDAAPISIWHGDKDTAVPLEQSLRLYDALQTRGARVSLKIEPGMGHGDLKYYTSAHLSEASVYLDQYIRP